MEPFLVSVGMVEVALVEAAQEETVCTGGGGTGGDVDVVLVVAVEM